MMVIWSKITEIYFECSGSFCGDFVVEIKCPYSICETVPTEENLPYLHKVETENGSDIKLKTSHYYYKQFQGQLEMTNKTFAWFFVFTHYGYFLERIEFDKNHWNKVLINLNQFCESIWLPNLFNHPSKVQQ